MASNGGQDQVYSNLGEGSSESRKEVCKNALSKERRATSLKATLNQIPNYYLSLFPIPLGVVPCLEMVIRKFIWGGCEERQKIHRVEWETLFTKGGWRPWAQVLVSYESSTPCKMVMELWGSKGSPLAFSFHEKVMAGVEPVETKGTE